MKLHNVRNAMLVTSHTRFIKCKQRARVFSVFRKRKPYSENAIFCVSEKFVANFTVEKQKLALRRAFVCYVNI